MAFYSLIHVPRVHHAGLLARVRRWLRPGGVLVASLGWHDLPVGTDPDWLGGGPMHWSFFDAQTNLRLLSEAGLQVEEAKVVPQLEDEVRVSFLWVVAHKPADHHDEGLLDGRLRHLPGPDQHASVPGDALRRDRQHRT